MCADPASLVNQAFLALESSRQPDARSARKYDCLLHQHSIRRGKSATIYPNVILQPGPCMTAFLYCPFIDKKLRAPIPPRTIAHPVKAGSVS